MLENTQIQIATDTANRQRVYSTRSNPRMAGSIAVWEKPSNAKQHIEARLASAQTNQARPGEFANALTQPDTKAQTSPENFTFGDLFDMFNPLQHIPLVGTLYRELTGDQIKPAGKIVGGAVFGGFAGVAGSLANVIVERETGKDITDNAMAFLRDGKKPSFQHARKDNHPEAAFETAMADKNDLPASLLRFTDQTTRPDGVRIEKINAAQGRTAGHQYIKSYPEDVEAAPMREPITQLSMKPLPPKPRYNS